MFSGSLVPASTFLRAIDSLAPRKRRLGTTSRGSHFVAAPSTYTSTEVYKSVVVRDFNQLAVRKSAAGEREKKSESSDGLREISRLEVRGMSVVADATVFEPTGVFREEVTTALPYMERIFVPTEDGEFNAVLLAEDAMVLVAGT